MGRELVVKTSSLYCSVSHLDSIMADYICFCVSPKGFTTIKINYSVGKIEPGLKKLLEELLSSFPK